jgi:hypothetical protein
MSTGRGLTRFSVRERLSVERLHCRGYLCSKIANIINQTRAINRRCTSRGVRKLLTRVKSGNLSRSSQYYVKRKLTSDCIALIDTAVNSDREINAVELQRRVSEQLGIHVSVSTINRERRKLGWVQTTTKYCQMVRIVNMDKRLHFCLDFLSRGETFNDVIFTDECTVRCERFLSKQFRRRHEPSIQIQKPKHPLSVCYSTSLMKILFTINGIYLILTQHI